MSKEISHLMVDKGILSKIVDGDEFFIVHSKIGVLVKGKIDNKLPYFKEV